MSDVKNETKPAAATRAPAISEETLLASLAALPRDKLAAVIATAQAPPTSKTPKLSAALEAITSEAQEQVTEALHGALANIEAGHADPLVDLRRVAPALEQHLILNAQHRGKPLRHSVTVAIAWFEQRQSPPAPAARGRR